MFSIETGVYFKPERTGKREVESVEGKLYVLLVLAVFMINVSLEGSSSQELEFEGACPRPGLQDLTNNKQPVETKVVTSYRQLNNGWIQTTK